MEKLNLCEHCNGTGELSTTVGAGRDFDEINYTCGYCNGTGRVKTITLEISVPFDESSTKIHDELVIKYIEHNLKYKRKSEENLEQKS